MGLVMLAGIACDSDATPAPKAVNEAPALVEAPGRSAPGANAQGAILLEEHFDDEASLNQWTVGVGAQRGQGSNASVRFDGGAVLFESTPDDVRWPMLTREVTLESAGSEPLWVAIRGTVRSEDLDAQAAHFANCHLFIKHSGGLVATRVLSGTNAETELMRAVLIPAGIKTFSVGVFASMPGRAWFDDVRVERMPPPERHSETAGHFRYITLGDDTVDDVSRTYNEESFRIVSEFLGVQRDAPIDFFKYPDRAAKELFTANPGNAHRSGAEIHSLWATDRHEIVHVLADAWGDPPALIAEGLAVHLSGDGRASL